MHVHYTFCLIIHITSEKSVIPIAVADNRIATSILYQLSVAGKQYTPNLYDSNPLSAHLTGNLWLRAPLRLHSSCWQKLCSPLKMQRGEGHLLQSSLMCLLIGLDLVPHGSHHRAASTSLQAIQRRVRVCTRRFPRWKT